MSDKIKSKIGEELYNKVLEAGLKPEDFDIVSDGSYVPRARLNEISGKLKATEGKVTDYENQIKETKKLLDNSEDFKSKFSALTKQYENDIKAKDVEILNTSKRFLVEQYLNNKGAIHTDLLMGKIDLNNLSLDNGNLIGMDSAFEGLQKDYKDMFVEKNKNNNSTNNSNNNDNNNDTQNDEDWGNLLKEFE